MLSPTSPPTAAGVKRKREPSKPLKFYAVRAGKQPGIYHSWPECHEQIRGFSKPEFKSFTSLTEAQAFMDRSGIAGGGGAGKWYGVQRGRKPGVYTSWPEVLEQITGWKNPKHKGFKTRVEAELFVMELQHGSASSVVSGGDSADIIADMSAKKAKTAKGKKVVATGTTAGRDEISPPPALEQGEYEAGDGPLPEGAEDNFDPTIVLDHRLGTARYKSAAEMTRTKYQAVAPVRDAPIRIYTDGSSLDNGQSDAMAGVGVYFGAKDRRNVSEPLVGTKQTNQRAELTAVMRALEVGPRDRRLEIVSDSNYAIKCVTEWFVRWRENSWLNTANKPVENKDLIVKVIDLLEERVKFNKHREEYGGEQTDGTRRAAGSKGYWDRGPAGVKFEWVKGHGKDEGNSAADALAVNGSRIARELGEDVVLD